MPLGAMKQQQYDVVSVNNWIYNAVANNAGNSEILYTDTNNNIYTIGDYSTGVVGQTSVYVLKYNQQGQYQWGYFYVDPTSTYIGPTMPGAGGGVTADADFLYVSVSTSGNSPAYNGMRILKIKISDGNLSQDNYWNTTGPSLSTTPYGITISQNGNLIVTNSSTNTNYGGVFSMTKGGTVNWTLNSGANSPRGNPVTNNSNDIYFCATKTASSNVMVQLAKVSSTGSSTFVKLINAYNVNVSDLAAAVGDYTTAIDSTGNVYLALYNNTTGSPVKGTNLLKFDSSGTLLWQRAIQGNTGSTVRPFSITVDSLDNIYVANDYNFITSGSDRNYSTVITKYNSEGSLLYSRRWSSQTLNYGATGSTIVCDSNSIKINAAGDIIINPYYGNYTTISLLSLPADGTRTGTYVIGNVTFLYSDPSSLISSITSNLIVTSDTAYSGAYLSTNFSNVNILSTNTVATISSTNGSLILLGT